MASRAQRRSHVLDQMALVKTDLTMTDKLTVLTSFKSSVGTQSDRALLVLQAPPTWQVGSMA